MAKKPSSRRHRIESSTELNITPIMNLMIVLVPFLLLAAVFSKTAVLNIYLPSAEEAALNEDQQEEELLSLTVAITKNGFSIGGIESEKIPDIIFKDNKYNYNALSKQLEEIKNKFPKSEDIVLLIEPNIEYDIIVHTMDASREIKKGKVITPLFSNVSLADSIILTGVKD